MNEPLSLVLAPDRGGPRKGVLPPGLVLTAFLLSEVTGAIIQPCLPLTRRMAINVVSLACVSWVSIPRGSENQSGVSELCERPPLT